MFFFINGLTFAEITADSHAISPLIRRYRRIFQAEDYHILIFPDVLGSIEML